MKRSPKQLLNERRDKKFQKVFISSFLYTHRHILCAQKHSRSTEKNKDGRCAFFLSFSLSFTRSLSLLIQYFRLCFARLDVRDERKSIFEYIFPIE